MSALARDQNLMDEKLVNDQSQPSNDQMIQMDDMRAQAQQDMDAREGENPGSNNTESKKNQESGCDSIDLVLSFAHLLSMLLVYLSIIIMRKTRLFYLNPQHTRK
jgi:negative regulator of genetic competence, sporulation and motility